MGDGEISMSRAKNTFILMIYERDNGDRDQAWVGCFDTLLNVVRYVAVGPNRQIQDIGRIRRY